MTASLAQPAADFAKGLAGVIAGQTRICSLDGTLRYRGYDIDALAAAGDFEEVAYLLLHGELPTRAELAAFCDRVSAAASTVDATVIDALARLAATSPHASVMDALRTGVSMLGLIERDDTPGPRAALLDQAERLLGQTPAILAAWIDLTSGRSPQPWPAGSIATSLLRATGLARRPRSLLVIAAIVVYTILVSTSFNIFSFILVQYRL